jgi:hypothetical protein
MATTPNYGFIMPDPTDFVTDLPADFEIFGDEVDLRIKALNPETTEGDLAYRGSTVDAKDRLGIGTAGQVLAVNATEDAPEWVTPAGGIPATILDAKGDLIAASADDTADRLAVGANGTVLTADSGETTGLKWVAPAGALTLIGSGQLVGGESSITISLTSINSFQGLKVVYTGIGFSTNAQLYCRPGGITGATAYTTVHTRMVNTTAASGGSGFNTLGAIPLTAGANSRTNPVLNGEIWFGSIYNNSTGGDYSGRWSTMFQDASGNGAIALGAFYYSNASEITSMVFLPSTGNFASTGRFRVYGVK